MPIINRIADFHAEMTDWRRHLHEHPEIAFEEHETSAFVARKLESFGLEVHRGLAGTGIVASLRGDRGSGDRAIALRSDMDALPIQEETGLPYASRNPGRMHACGHDGHTTMLLGAAKYLAETRNFAGTVHFVFQPAEENEGGGRVMVEQGLFDKFPSDAVFGMHNWPGMDAGTFAIRPGPIMASFDVFEIKLKGRGTHAAMPHTGTDVVLASAQLVTALQALVSRETHPVEALVVSVTQIHGGDAWNVLPAEVTLRGTTRAFSEATQDRAEKGMRRIAEGIASTYGITFEFMYERRYPPTLNEPRQTEVAAAVAGALVGTDRVDRNPMPTMGAEDFAFMLAQTPGAMIWIGNGPTDDERVLHNPHYDFNDEILPLGASYWAQLVERELAG